MKSVLAVVLLAAAANVGCGASTGAPGLCEGANPPPECSLECEPPPAPNTCPAGFFCGPGGTCTDTPPADASLDPDADCPSVTFTTTRTIPTVQLLIDQSGSMNSYLEGTTTRWQAVKTALVNPNTGIVARMEDQVVFGATLYTSFYGGDVPDECPVLTSTSARALGNFDEIRQLFQDAQPEIDTPTGESIDAVVADFAANPPAAGSPPIILLATDGEPDSCADPDALARDLSVAAAADAYAAGIQVFVLSVGTEVAEGHLQDVANAGVGAGPGDPDAPYYVADSPAELEAAFDAIIGGVVSCELTLDGEIDVGQADEGTVTLNGEALTYGTEWEATSSTTIRLIGGGCDALTSTPDPVVSANFPCGAVID
jgi:hypothetical protein